MKKKRTLYNLWICFAMLLFLAVPAKVKAAVATTPVTISVQYGQTEARTILDMINEMRTSSTDAWYWNKDDTEKIYCTDLQPLQYDYDLEKVAMQRAVEIALVNLHTRPNNTNCTSALYENSIYPNASGENIAAGYATASDVNNGWREDDADYDGQGHRRNMLFSDFNCVGIGHVYYNGIHYWVEEFANRNDINTNSVSADNAQATVSVPVATTKISNFNITFNKSEYSIKAGENIAVSVSYPAVAISGHWPSAYVLVEDTPELTIADSAIASLSETLTGLSEGETTISASLYGLTAKQTATVKVHDCDNHWDEGKITTAPACTTTGTKLYTCTICGATKPEEVSALGHDYSSDWTVDTAATCSTPGSKSHHCSRCDSKSDVTEIQATGMHSWDDGVITKPATVDATGEKTYTCTVCGEKKIENIAKLPTPTATPVPTEAPIPTTTPVPIAPPAPSVSVGKTISDKKTGNQYKVTSNSSSNPTIAFTGNKTKSSVTIPATVKINSVTYKVTEISANAFKNNKRIKKLVIGTNIVKIGKNAFYGCKNLTSITIKTSRLTLKNVGSNAFKNTSPKATVKVPKKQKTLYSQILKKRGLSKKTKVK